MHPSYEVVFTNKHSHWILSDSEKKKKVKLSQFATVTSEN